MPADTTRIIQDPDILVGKPVIRGTRISVELVLEKLSEDLDVDGLLESYPHITLADYPDPGPFLVITKHRIRAR